jgi:transcription antitermination protein NusB
MSNRREARERVMQALYAREMGRDEVTHLVKTLLEPDLKEDPVNFRFAQSLFIRTLDMTEEADALIAGHATNWDIGRIALIDRLVLRMSICEFLQFEDIPPKVTINEAIEIAKRFSTDRSGQFVNGILDATLADLKRDGRIKKSGRGLLDMPLPGGTYS